MDDDGHGLIAVGTRSTDAVANVVFVHGLGGDRRSTWQHGSEPGSFWPQWLCEDLNARQPVNVWSLGYPADVFHTLFFPHVTTDSLPERARQLAGDITANDLHLRPLIFVAHSLGGLLVEQMLRSSSDKRHFPGEPLAQLSLGTRLVVLIATPHSGSGMASIAKRIPAVATMATKSLLSLFGQFPLVGHLARLVVRPGPLTSALERGDPHLADLAAWYRDNSIGLGIETAIYYENTKTKGVTMVVDEQSANLGISGAIVEPIDGDHLEICKPRSRQSRDYARYRATIERTVSKAPAFAETHLAVLDVGRSFEKLTELHPKERMLATKKVVQPIEVRLGRSKSDVDYPQSDAGTGKFQPTSGILSRAAISEYDLDRVILAVWNQYRGGLSESEPTMAIRHEVEQLMPALSRPASEISLVPLYYSARAIERQRSSGGVQLSDGDRETISKALSVIESRRESPLDGDQIDEDGSTRAMLRKLEVGTNT